MAALNVPDKQIRKGLRCDDWLSALIPFTQARILWPVSELLLALGQDRS